MSRINTNNLLWQPVKKAASSITPPRQPDPEQKDKTYSYDMWIWLERELVANLGVPPLSSIGQKPTPPARSMQPRPYDAFNIATGIIDAGPEQQPDRRR